MADAAHHPGMRVVVTGASGFIGREAIAPLRSLGAEIHLLGRARTPVAGAIVHDFDILTDDPVPVMARIAPTHLLHFAWYAEPGKFWHARENLDWVAASLRLVGAFADAGGRRAALAGSCAEYDWSAGILSEDTTPLRPGTLYGEAKASLFRILGKAGPVLNISIAWGRIFFPYGPHESGSRLIGSTMDALIRNEAASYTQGMQARDFMHVDDVAAAFVALLGSDVEGAVNIASGTAIAVRALVERAAAISGRTAKLQFGTRPPQPDEPPLLVGQVDRLRHEVGFQPRFVLDTGLRDTWERRRDAAPRGRTAAS